MALLTSVPPSVGKVLHPSELATKANRKNPTIAAILSSLALSRQAPKADWSALNSAQQFFFACQSQFLRILLAKSCPAGLAKSFLLGQKLQDAAYKIST